jgi:DNA-binding IclR family transcriptional regulator
VIAAIALGGPRYRVSPERLESEFVPMALRAAARVSEALGHVAA